MIEKEVELRLLMLHAFTKRRKFCN